MIVSHSLPSPTVAAWLIVWSAFLVSRMILPLGLCTASFAGLMALPPTELPVLALPADMLPELLLLLLLDGCE
jgi:hypothetical protein